MIKKFRKETGEIVDLIQHTLEVLGTQQDVKIFVGTDSQNKHKQSCYVTSVAYKYGNRGAHCIYFKEHIPKIRDRYTRLWREVESSLQIAKHLEEKGFKVECVELDFNEKDIAKSHDMVAAARGYIIGSGFECNVKPETQSAVRYSDHICRR